jgi:hypothetical protein
MTILNFAKEKDFHDNSVFWLIYLRAYENALFWCLISTPYLYENLEFLGARLNMYKNILLLHDCSHEDSEFS